MLIQFISVKIFLINKNIYIKRINKKYIIILYLLIVLLSSEIKKLNNIYKKIKKFNHKYLKTIKNKQLKVKKYYQILINLTVDKMKKQFYNNNNKNYKKINNN